LVFVGVNEGEIWVGEVTAHGILTEEEGKRVDDGSLVKGVVTGQSPWVILNSWTGLGLYIVEKGQS
jgi:hypothetical protein